MWTVSPQRPSRSVDLCSSEIHSPPSSLSPHAFSTAMQGTYTTHAGIRIRINITVASGEKGRETTDGGRELRDGAGEEKGGDRVEGGGEGGGRPEMEGERTEVEGGRTEVEGWSSMWRDG